MTAWPGVPIVSPVSSLMATLIDHYDYTVKTAERRIESTLAFDDTHLRELDFLTEAANGDFAAANIAMRSAQIQSSLNLLTAGLRALEVDNQAARQIAQVSLAQLVDSQSSVSLVDARQVGEWISNAYGIAGQSLSEQQTTDFATVIRLINGYLQDNEGSGEQLLQDYARIEKLVIEELSPLVAD